MTREEFERFLAQGQTTIHVDPYDVVPCNCSDVNCKGWRLVQPRVRRRLELRYVGEFEPA